jgi:hypothetical protein
MANPKHVAKLKEGKDAWNDWRDSTSEVPDLREANLAGRNFVGYDFKNLLVDFATLAGSRFANCNLEDASFRNAYGMDARFYGSYVQRCDFRQTGLHGARFDYTVATGADFRGADLSWAFFDTCDLEHTSFADARLTRTTFSNVSLRNAEGLDQVGHGLAISIGIDTFFKSGGLPESFLRAAGVPEEFIQYAASLVGKAIEYYSCFLSYSSNDNEFAHRLNDGLRGRNITTWFAPEDLKIGDRFRPRIDEPISIHDKLVLILSANSVSSDWVESEVESALERERKEGRDVLFPIAIDEEGFTSQQSWAADIRRKRHIGDFRQWKSHDDYTRAFDKLVRDLKKSQPPIIMKG